MSTSPGEPARVPAEERSAALENCIRQIAAGDREALGRLYEETRTAMFAFALSIVKNRQDAEDVLQDVYVKIWQSAPGYRAEGKPLSWMFVITRNFARMSLRRSSRTTPVAAEEWEGMFVEGAQVGAEDALVLRSVLELLDEDERQIVLLHAVVGFKHRESAELLDMGLSTVLSKYSRALKKLRMALEEEE